MDTLTTACIVLTVTTIAFWLLAESYRRTARRIQAQSDLDRLRAGKLIQEARADALIVGLKRGYGEMYLAVVKADRDGRDVVAAARRVGQMNAPALLEEPVVQVLEEV